MRPVAYPTKFLTQDEHVVREFKPHWHRLIGPVLAVVVGLVVAVGTWQIRPENPTADWVITGAGVLFLLIFGLAPFVRWFFT